MLAAVVMLGGAACGGDTNAGPGTRSAGGVAQLRVVATTVLSARMRDLTVASPALGATVKVRLLLPVRRMGLPVSGRAAAPAAYVRAAGLAVQRLEQTYARITDEAACQRYDYAAPAFGFAARLVYDKSGLVLDYPGIAVRAG